MLRVRTKLKKGFCSKCPRMNKSFTLGDVLLMIFEESTLRLMSRLETGGVRLRSSLDTLSSPSSSQVVKGTSPADSLSLYSSTTGQFGGHGWCAKACVPHIITWCTRSTLLWFGLGNYLHPLWHFLTLGNTLCYVIWRNWWTHVTWWKSPDFIQNSDCGWR